MKKLVLLLMGLGVAPTWAMDYSLNPDRWISADFMAGGSYNLPREADVTSGKITYPRQVSGSNENFFLNVLVPITNHWTVSGGWGMTSNQSRTDETPATAGTSTDDPSIDGQVTGRYYFVNQALIGTPPPQNPDRWPSLALTMSGSGSIYDELSETTAANDNFRSNNFTQNLSFAGDTRLPLSNAITWLTSLETTFGVSDVAEGTSAAGADEPGTETRRTTLTLNSGMRYYFVGKNCISDDLKKNPDEWASVSLVASGATSLRANQIITAQGKPGDDRNIDTKTAGGTLEFRLPVTNSTTLRFGLTCGVSRTQIPQTASNAGSSTFQPSIGGYIGIHGYFD